MENFNTSYLLQVKTYIEDTEVSNDGEWGLGRTLEELIELKSMPKVYYDTLALIEASGATAS